MSGYNNIMKTKHCPYCDYWITAREELVDGFIESHIEENHKNE